MLTSIFQEFWFVIIHYKSVEGGLHQNKVNISLKFTQKLGY